MPPKRKLNEDDSMQAMRSTRTRSKTITSRDDSAEIAFGGKRVSKVSISNNRVEDHEDSMEQTEKAAKIVDRSSTQADEDRVKKTLTDDSPYTPQRALALFEVYAETDEPNIIGPEGFEKLCGDASLSMEGPVPLILAWQMNAKEMAKISKEEWVSGMKDLQISSLKYLVVALTDLEDLLLFGKPPIKKSKTNPYDRTKYWHYAADTKEAFRKFYHYCFILVKPPSSKNIEMETAAAFWSVLLGPKYPVMRDILDFINEKGTYRAANKDLWTMVLEFCETVNPNLDNFEVDGAWPTLLDEFASWKMGKSDV
ncbi:hypothetical protein Ac2012v2_001383 [Leucoagaricus gongylophorus]